MVYAVGTDKKDGTVAPEKSSGVAAASKAAAGVAKTPVTASAKKVVAAAPKKSTSTGAVAKAAPAARSVADTASWGSDKSDTPAKRVVKTTTVTPDYTGSQTARSAPQVVRPPGGLNSDRFYQRVAENAGVKPFEGPVDWNGIGRAIFGLPPALMDAREAANAPVDITVHGGGRSYDLVSDQPLSWGNMLDFIGTPEVSSTNLPPIEEGTTYYPPGGDYGYDAKTGEYVLKQPGGNYVNNPLTPNERRALAMIGGVENPALGGIAAAVAPPAELPDLVEPGIAESSSAGDLFETDGRTVTPGGVVLNPGSRARSNGIDVAAAAVAPRESTVWTGVVDNAGKLLSHTGLGGIVSALFPDMWNGMGDAFKSIGTGEVNSLSNPTGNPSASYWDKANLRWTGGGASDDGGNRKPQEKPPVTPPPSFPDLNHNGIDDRIEGYTGPDTNGVPGAPGSKFGRTARFPFMPPYNPGISDEWSYFTDNHLADGGMVYAEGGSIDPTDPRVRLIGETEDVLEKIAGGSRPDEAEVVVLKKFVAQFGDAALRSLNDNVTGGMTMRGGRMIRGPGGPKDDAVPAVIVEEGTPVSPAKLSNGEFVMPVSAVEGAGGPEAMQELAERLSKRSAA